MHWIFRAQHPTVVVLPHSYAMDSKSTVQVVNGDIFYSPNCARKLTLPTPGDDNGLYRALRTGGLTSENLQHPRWWTPPTEWLAFVPCSPVLFTGTLLESLSFIPRCMSYNEQVGFTLPPLFVKEWSFLEEILDKVTNDLSSKHALLHWRPFPPNLPIYLPSPTAFVVIL